MAQAAERLDDDDDDITVLGDEADLGTPEERGDFLTPPEPEPPGAVAPAVAAEDDEAEAIPKARFDQERIRRLMAEAELQRMQEALATRGQPVVPPEPVLSIEELDRAAWEAAMEGDEGKAAQLRAQMLAQMEQRAVQAAEQAIERRSAEAELKKAVSEVRAAYPQLDADPALTQDVVAYRDFLYAQQGLPLAEALRRAAKTVLGPAPTPGATAPAALGGKPDPAAERRRAAVERAATASRQQPVAAAAVGVGMRAHEAPTRNVDEMSEEEFASLTPAELKRMRGDAG